MICARKYARSGCISQMLSRLTHESNTALKAIQRYGCIPVSGLVTGDIWSPRMLDPFGGLGHRALKRDRNPISRSCLFYSIVLQAR